jgi:glycyl-tRNA synthetase (class II)
VTVDVQTVGDREKGETGDGRVTIRDRDSMQQVRVPEGELLPVFRELLEGGDWGAVVARFGGVTADAGRPGEGSR